MTDRYCTVYLPETKQPMYPSILTGCLTSLTHNTQRIVFAIDVYIQGNDGGIVGVEYENALICVNQNYTYAKVNEFLENNNPYFVRLSNIVKVIKPQISHVNQCVLMMLMANGFTSCLTRIQALICCRNLNFII